MFHFSRVIVVVALVSGCVYAQKAKSAADAPVAVKFAPAHADSVAVDLTVHLPNISDSLLQAKLDSLSAISESKPSVAFDSAQIKDSTNHLRAAVKQGKYIDRALYDKSNFDHWKIDSVLQAKQKNRLLGGWRTDIMEHGHAFLDEALKFGNNDTLYSTTYTYTDSGRFYKTGEYAYHARYRFESDSTYRSREVFSDRNVVRWDYVLYKTTPDSLRHHLYKLEFRDMMDNWLDAIQQFDRISPELYHRTESAVPVSAVPKKNPS